MPTVYIIGTNTTSLKISSVLKKESVRSISIPILHISAPTSWIDIDNSIKSAEKYDGVIFASPIAVKNFIKRKNHISVDTVFKNVFAIGQATVDVLEDNNIKVDRSDHYLTDLADFLIDDGNKLNLVFYRVISGYDESPTQRMNNNGITVTELGIYDTIYNENIDKDRSKIIHNLEHNLVDAFVFTSPKAVRLFDEHYNEYIDRRKYAICMGKTTRQQCADLKYENAYSPIVPSAVNVAKLTKYFVYLCKK